MKKQKIIAVFSSAAMLVTSAISPAFAKEWEVSTNDEILKAFEEDTDETVTITLKGDVELLQKLKSNKGQIYIINGKAYVLKNATFSGAGDITINGNLEGVDGADALTTKDDVVVTVKGNIKADCDGVYANDNSKVTVEGNIIAGDDGVGSYGNSEVIVKGNITADSDGIYVNDNSIVTVTGDIDADYDGVDIDDNASATVTGNINVGDNGVEADDDAKVIVNGNITAENYGVDVEDNANITINGDITADDDGINAEDNANVTVNGNIISGGEGIQSNYDTVITVNGNITADSEGVDVCDNSIVTVTGDINAGNDGVEADDDAKVTVNGNITATDDGVDAEDNAVVTVDGNIIAGEYGIEATENSSVTVNGDVTSVNENDLTEEEMNDPWEDDDGYDGIYAIGNSTVTVNGNVTGGDAYGTYGYAGNGIYSEGNVTVTVTGNVTGGSVHAKEDVKAIGNHVSKAGDGIEAESDTNITVKGNVAGGTSNGDKGIDGFGINVVLLPVSSSQLGSILVDGIVSGAKHSVGINFNYFEGNFNNIVYVLNSQKNIILDDFLAKDTSTITDSEMDTYVETTKTIRSYFSLEYDSQYAYMEHLCKHLGITYPGDKVLDEDDDAYIALDYEIQNKLSTLEIDEIFKIYRSYIKDTQDTIKNMKEAKNTVPEITVWQVDSQGNILKVISEDKADEALEPVLTQDINYIIRTQHNENVDIKLDKESAKKGETVTIHVSAKEGYKVKAVMNGTKELKANKDGSYSFVVEGDGNEISVITEQLAKLPQVNGVQTGDDSNIALFGFAGIASLLTMITTRFKKKEQ